MRGLTSDEEAILRRQLREEGLQDWPGALVMATYDRLVAKRDRRTIAVLNALKNTH